MPKRDIPVDANEDTRFAVIMDGLINANDHSLKQPKDGRMQGPEAKWRFLANKEIGMTNGYLVSKNAKPGSTKHERIWLYKTDKSDHYERYFYASFCETVGSELFRFTLGELAPKNRLTKVDDEAPGIVSRFLPDFISLSTIQKRLSEQEKPFFSEQVSGLEGIEHVIAANCFFNDYDGSFFNTGLFMAADGKRKVGRIDFGTALANFLDHTYGIGLYLFGAGRYDYRYHYARIYAPLLKSEAFRLNIQNMATINLDYLDAIVRASIGRFVDAWKGIALDGPAIVKLLSHLYGENKEKWYRCGYTEIPTIQLDLDQFNTVICDEIIAAFTEKKKIFAFFAKALACQDGLCAFSAGMSEENREDVLALIHDAEEDSANHKRLLLTWLTGNRLQFTVDGKLMAHHGAELAFISLDKNAEGKYPEPNSPCGVLPFYIENNQIIWGCVESNRVGAKAIAPPAGTQDIIIIRGNERFTIEVAKPFPYLGLEFLQQHIGKPFRGSHYQEILACIVNHGFKVYMEEPIATAIHEAREEHGVDLREVEERDIQLLNAVLEFSPQKIHAKRGLVTQHVWVAYLKNSNGIPLSRTDKIEQKIQVNKGNQFYERGCWKSLEELKAHLKGEKEKYNQLDAPVTGYTVEQIELIKKELSACENRIILIEKIEASVVPYLKGLEVQVNSIADLEPIEFNGCGSENQNGCV